MRKSYLLRLRIKNLQKYFVVEEIYVKTLVACKEPNNGAIPGIRCTMKLQAGIHVCILQIRNILKCTVCLCLWIFQQLLFLTLHSYVKQISNLSDLHTKDCQIAEHMHPSKRQCSLLAVRIFSSSEAINTHYNKMLNTHAKESCHACQGFEANRSGTLRSISV